MKITIENTSRIVMVNGMQYRVWEGFTDAGIPCHAFIRHITAEIIDMFGHASKHIRSSLFVSTVKHLDGKIIEGWPI